MPASFESFGIRFLYPENWTPLHRADTEQSDGVTLELPSGGFFSIERERDGQLFNQLIEEIAESFEKDYGEVEREVIPAKASSGIQQSVEFRFYYLDLLIISRILDVDVRGTSFIIQIQAESRDFDQNEKVFDAILQQLTAAA
jgi:hypothetical protein